MKKLAYLAVGLLLLSSIAIIGIGEEAGDLKKTISVDFSDIKIVESNISPFSEIRYQGSTGCLYQASEPVLPRYTETLTFPFGTEIMEVNCQVGEVKEQILSNKIIPAPTPVNPGIDESNEAEYIMKEIVYDSNEFYPNTWFEYSKHAGLDENGEHKIFLNIQGYPVQYNPTTNTVKYVNEMDFTVEYREPETDYFPSTSEYELAIIAPSIFSDDLQKLVDHKIDMGMSTILMTTEEIYTQYTSGYDKPEKIKLFIKDAIETYNIKYVLLVGGLNSYLYGTPRDNLNEGTKDWHVPVRYSNIKEMTGGTKDPGLISDLYFADIYNGDNEFDDWDSNDDQIYARWDNRPGKDKIDTYPDVYVGRLACRNKLEVKVMVNKIINYEKRAHEKSWVNKMIVIGGDSHEDPPTHFIEGEVVAEKILDEYMDEYSPVRLYGSYKTSKPSYVPTRTNIRREINKGAGHLFLDGHANPLSWITHYPREFDDWIPNGGLRAFDMPKLLNLNKLPICAVEGCHNSQFNVSILFTLSDKDNSKHSWCYGVPVPKCWSWWLASKIGGGSIATIGNTGLGYGAVGEHGDLDGDNITEPDTVEALGGFWFCSFYEAIDEGAEYLGQAWGLAEYKYLQVFPPMSNQADTKTVQQLILHGDPSLKIGGYETFDHLSAEIVDGAAGIVGAPNEEIMFTATAYNGDNDYNFVWDFDNDGEYDDAQGEISSYTWKKPGVYWISMKATDGQDSVDIFDTIVSIEFGASSPSKPVGETRIKPGVTYTYESSINTQGDYWNKVLYKFSWGDGTETEWLESATASHSWNRAGSYQIKVKALLTHESTDVDDAENIKETDWSESIYISLSKDTSSTGPLNRLIQYILGKYPNAFPIMRILLGL